MLTFLPIEEIRKMETWEGADLNKAKEILAFELTKLVHGEEEANRAIESARAIFTSGDSANMPTTELGDEDFNEGVIDILSILQKSELVPSRAEGRRAIEQGGVSVNNDKITDVKLTFTKKELEGEGIIVRRGKKNYKKIIAK